MRTVTALPRTVICVMALVFSFLEGRRVSEILGAGLSVSFIVSSGVVKSVGKWLMLDLGVNALAVHGDLPELAGLLGLGPGTVEAGDIEPHVEPQRVHEIDGGSKRRRDPRAHGVSLRGEIR